MTSATTIRIPSPASGSVTHSGLHRTPNALICCGNSQLAGGVGTGVKFTIGFCDAALSKVALAYTSNDAVGTTETQLVGSTSNAALLVDEAGSTQNSMAPTAYTNDGFTATWSTAIEGALLNVLGIKCSNSAVFNTTLPGSVSNFSVAGLGFQPNFIMLVSFAEFGVGQHKSVSLGFAAGTSMQECITISDQDNAGTSNSGHEYRGDIVGAVMTPTADQERISFVSFDSGGFTLHDDLGGGTATTLYGIALQLDQVKVGHIDLASSTGDQAGPSLGFAPDLVMFIYSLSGGTTPTAHAELGFSWAAGPLSGTGGGLQEQASIVAVSEDNVGTSNTNQVNIATALYVTDQVINTTHIATMKNFTNDSWTLNYIAASGTYRIAYAAFGSNRDTWLKGGHLKGGHLK